MIKIEYCLILMHIYVEINQFEAISIYFMILETLILHFELELFSIITSLRSSNCLSTSFRTQFGSKV